MKYSLWESYKDEGGNVDFQRSQMGTGMSKKGEPKRFVAHLSKVAYQNSNNRFSFEELHEIAKEMNLQFTSFQDLLDTLNNQGYLLKKGHRIYQLCTAS